MAQHVIDIDFRTDLIAQDRIKGRLMSGQWFAGKLNGVGKDYFIIVELQVGNSPQELELQPLDLVKMRVDSVMFFGEK